MIVGVPRERKSNEGRVGVVAGGVAELVRHRHRVIVERGAGIESGIGDEKFRRAGAEIAANPESVWTSADMVVKVKEPVEAEYPLMRPDQIVFAFFHFAASRALADACVASRIIAIAYETVRGANGSLPVLAPMSEIAGKMAVLEGAKCLQRPHGGRGALLGEIQGVPAAHVLVLGGGTAGTAAAGTAAAVGADVTLLEVDPERIRVLEKTMSLRVKVQVSNIENLRRLLPEVDLVVGAVYVRGARAPKLIDRKMLGLMRPGSAIVDLAVDQGGCVETCRPTSHENPTYVVDGVVHYCVANIPGAVPLTATAALTRVTQPMALRIADLGYREAALADRAIASGVNIVAGHVTHRTVAESLGLPYEPLEAVLAGPA